jgi:hypothetical protein
MRALRFVPASIVLVLAVGISTAAASTHVKINSWHVYTKDHKLHKVKPGKTFKACKSNPTAEIDAKGKVTDATEFDDFSETWSVNGTPDSIFGSTWSQSGTFTDYFSLVADDHSLKTGNWKLLLTHGNRTLGKSSITLKKKTRGC